MRSTRDIFRKITEIKGSFNTKMVMIKASENKNLVRKENIEKKWHNYMEELHKTVQKGH